MVLGKIGVFPCHIEREEATHRRAAGSGVFAPLFGTVVLSHKGGDIVLVIVGRAVGVAGDERKFGVAVAAAVALFAIGMTAVKRLIGGVGGQILGNAFVAAIAHADDETFAHVAVGNQRIGRVVGPPRTRIAVVGKALKAVLAVVHVQDGVFFVGVLVIATGQVDVECPAGECACEVGDFDDAGEGEGRGWLVVEELPILHPELAQVGAVKIEAPPIFGDGVGVVADVYAELPCPCGGQKGVGSPADFVAHPARACMGEGEAGDGGVVGGRVAHL